MPDIDELNEYERRFLTGPDLIPIPVVWKDTPGWWAAPDDSNDIGHALVAHVNDRWWFYSETERPKIEALLAVHGYRPEYPTR